MFTWYLPQGQLPWPGSHSAFPHHSLSSYPPLHAQVTLAEFQDYYRGLSASVDTDSEFVAMVSNAWRL